ncbi:EscU/YscU/HrcU family type III secretion system export apparatus switch protein [Oceanobacillus halophilus]|uniref:EscU/YscU/HrcU family type III secretion system export apparatus switch protein n=1 Tax=Oceanobacillus halophilus TaxID=930130 RepID=A0A495ABT7_9BACI|nr:EscU/YscU/HrcU family type III secretion system export apparatus switch protein [Oceanobacillus halophilus]RKQ37469.1 hypothetical protein D8M06_01295 [Oceanobacillus halophilus]
MKNNQKKAAALSYDSESNSAPILSASGKNLIAEEMIALAKTNQIPIVEDPNLVNLLAELNINEAIPEELYQAVAEVFAFIYHADKELNNEI